MDLETVKKVAKLAAKGTEEEHKRTQMTRRRDTSEADPLSQQMFLLTGTGTGIRRNHGPFDHFSLGATEEANNKRRGERGDDDWPLAMGH